MPCLGFRVWVKRYEKYMPLRSISFDPVSGEVVDITVVATGGAHLMLLPEEFILEQFTGLGVESSDRVRSATADSG